MKKVSKILVIIANGKNPGKFQKIQNRLLIKLRFSLPNKSAKIMSRKMLQVLQQNCLFTTISHYTQFDNGQESMDRLGQINGSSLLWKISDSLKCWLPILLLVLFINLLWKFAHCKLDF